MDFTYKYHTNGFESCEAICDGFWVAAAPGTLGKGGKLQAPNITILSTVWVQVRMLMRIQTLVPMWTPPMRMQMLMRMTLTVRWTS